MRSAVVVLASIVAVAADARVLLSGEAARDSWVLHRSSVEGRAAVVLADVLWAAGQAALGDGPQLGSWVDGLAWDRVARWVEVRARVAVALAEVHWRREGWVAAAVASPRQGEHRWAANRTMSTVGDVAR